MTVFERTYRELERLKGVSPHNDLTLYKIAPDEQERRDLWIGSHITELSPEHEKPHRGIWIGMAWCAALWIILGLIIWMVR